MASAIERMKEFFGSRYSFDPKDERVFGIWNTVKGQRINGKIFLGMEMFFGIIGALTLVIGCVGGGSHGLLRSARGRSAQSPFLDGWDGRGDDA